jgi:hypothetical protein
LNCWTCRPEKSGEGRGFDFDPDRPAARVKHNVHFFAMSGPEVPHFRLQLGLALVVWFTGG